ncbi:MAG TPA: hypothetical protein VGB83_07740 [Actinomycetota bacterium]
MKFKAVILVAAVAVALPVTASNAAVRGKGKLTFSAPVSCAPCPYNLSPEGVAEDAQRDGAGYDPNTALDQDHSDQWACSHPPPTPSYDDIALKAPAKAKLLVVNVTPGETDDWDIALCQKSAGGYRTLASDASGALGEPESMSASVKAGKTYVVRAFNFAAVEDLKGTYVFYG